MAAKLFLPTGFPFLTAIQTRCHVLTMTLCVALSLLACLASARSMASNSSPLPQAAAFAYEARMGPIVAGDLDLSVFRENDRYGVFGRFITSQSLNAYYNWEGIFVSSGIWVDQRPQTQSYLVRSESKDDEYKVVIMDEHSTQLLDGREAEFEILPKPNGTDLISGLMFTPQCYTGAFVHDGEDTYPIRLLKTGSSKLSKRRGFFAGPVTRCDYEITTRRGKKRRLRVSMAEHDGMWVAAEVRVRLALFPDPVFRLRS